MAIPSEYSTPRTTAGPTNLLHPSSTITVLVGRHLQESIGPLTNLKTGTVLHPDMYTSDPDRGLASIANHAAQISTWVPGLTAGDNIVAKGGVETATITGQQGVYIQDMATRLQA